LLYVTSLKIVGGLLTFWEAVLLGVIQGLTEFLPVSSSGHLVLGKVALGIEINDITFEIFVHFGTLLALLTVFKNDVSVILSGIKSLTTIKFSTHDKTESNIDSEGLRLLGLLIVGTFPTATIGLIFRENFEKAFSHPQFVCGALIITGLILITSRFAKGKRAQFDYMSSFFVGLAQIAAIFPGISRSGTTISIALLLGIHRMESARFSFLLAIPLILGATLVQTFELIAQLSSGDQILKLLVGTVAAYFSGLIAIRWLLSIINKGHFDRFAYYCFALGLFGLVLFTMG